MVEPSRCTAGPAASFARLILEQSMHMPTKALSQLLGHLKKVKPSRHSLGSQDFHTLKPPPPCNDMWSVGQNAFAVGCGVCGCGVLGNSCFIQPLVKPSQS